MNFFLLVLTLFIFGCSTNSGFTPRDGKRLYSYSDVSGSYRLQREIKSIKKKIITRSQLFSIAGSKKVLEKSVTVSQLGSVKEGRKRVMVLRPFASEFTVWLEGKKYHSRMKLVPEKKAVQVQLDSPEKKWQGTSLVPVPKGRHFCFYSQIPECLSHNQLLLQARENPRETFDFYIAWDSFPFIQEQLTAVGKSLFSPATIKFDGEIKKRIRYIIEVEGQVVLYKFSQGFDLEEIAWISQGITVVPPGEEVNEIENQ